MSFSTKDMASFIRGKRGQLDMTQGELADAVGVNVTTIVKYEDGRMIPGADKVFALADALKCAPNELLGWGR